MCPFQEDSYWNGTRILKHSGNNIHHDCHCSFDEVKHDDAKVAEKTEDEDLFPGDLVVTVVTADRHHVTMFRKLHQFDPGSVLVLDSRYRIGTVVLLTKRKHTLQIFAVAMGHWLPLQQFGQVRTARGVAKITMSAVQQCRSRRPTLQHRTGQISTGILEKHLSALV